MSRACFNLSHENVARLGHRVQPSKDSFNMITIRFLGAGSGVILNFKS